MSFHSLAKVTALASLASIVLATTARAECAVARLVPPTKALPEAWRAAVEELLRSTSEPGHPWSCSGGTVQLELTTEGALLGVAREGDELARRHVASPADVTPLGQALLALPMSSQFGELAPSAPAPAAPTPVQQPVLGQPQAGPAEAAQGSLEASTPPARRLLLSAGVDSRYVGRSNVAWIGPTVAAALTLGRWLPSISLRQQSGLPTDHRSLDEFSFALGLQTRFELSALELRTGLQLRGAEVKRDLPHDHGGQNRLEGRVGAVLALAIPVFRWVNVVVAADAEVVAVARATAKPDGSMDDRTPTSFPNYTLGGSACLEFPL